MKPPTFIQITKSDIENGKRYQTGYCPIALALNRNGFTNCVVGVTHTEFGRTEYQNSPDVINFINEFDFGYTIRPMTIKIDPINRVISLENENSDI